MPKRGSVLPAARPLIPGSPSLVPELPGPHRPVGETGRAELPAEAAPAPMARCPGSVRGVHLPVKGVRQLQPMEVLAMSLFPLDRPSGDIRRDADRPSPAKAPAFASTHPFLISRTSHLPAISITLPDAPQALAGTRSHLERPLTPAKDPRRLPDVTTPGSLLRAIAAKGRPDAAPLRACCQAPFGKAAKAPIDAPSVVWKADRRLASFLPCLVRRIPGPVAGTSALA